MKKKYNWAILGCGKIAAKFSSDIKLLPNVTLYAAASRDLEKAKKFAKKNGFIKSYGSYEEMVKDPEVDIVYVASPHSHHLEHTLLCLNHKKAVLCEKAFALNKKEAQKMVDASRENNTFLMEAFWTEFQPSFIKALQLANSGELGKLKMVRSDFAFKASYDPASRLFNLELGGGSLLDIGIYPVFVALKSLGKPERIKALADFAPSGAEESICMAFKYNSGQMATLASSYASNSSIQTEFWCEKGYVRLNRRWFTPTTLSVWKDTSEKEEVLEYNYKIGNGYQHEAAHVMECLDKGMIESDRLPLSFSLDLMETLDRVRQEAGIIFPGHDDKVFG